jgi:hypothetical protein
MKFERVDKTFDPEADLAARWPGWSVVEVSDMEPGDQEFYVDCQTVLVNSSECGRTWMVAHVTARLDQGQHLDTVDAFTVQQDRDVCDLAAFRLDYLAVSPDQRYHALELPWHVKQIAHVEGEWNLGDFPLDGEPSVPLTA